MMRKLLPIKISILNFQKRAFSNTNSITDFKSLLKNEEKHLSNVLKQSLVKNGKYKRVAFMYFFLSGIVFGIMVLGGYTRITKSGLSMVRWDLNKFFPPTSEREWQEEFNIYKNFPQFVEDYPTMNLKEFKRIYLVEFYHRVFAKGLGIATVLLLILNRKHITGKLLKWTLIVFSLGGLQGLVGWWMVKSGLVKKPKRKGEVSVSPYRLAFHFTNAAIIFGLLFKIGLILITKPSTLHSWESIEFNTKIRSKLMLSFHLYIFAMVYGCFMAGNQAGKVCNTFPKLGSEWFPSSAHIDDGWKSFFENKMLVHFNHRTLGIITLGTLYWQLWRILSMKNLVNPSAIIGFLLVTGLTTGQALLGYSSVVNSVPEVVALKHHALAVVTYGAFILAIHRVRKVRGNDLSVVYKHLYSKDKNIVERYMEELKYSQPKTYEKFFKNLHNKV